MSEHSNVHGWRGCGPAQPRPHAHPGRRENVVVQSNNHATREGFTVVEMIIAVAAVGLISIGLAQIFRATGETVRIGRRVSNLNTYATMIERQMRKDFDSMTREGFMVIHQTTAGGPAAPFAGSVIGVTPDDRAPRQRRVDELEFFAAGEFTSLRDPIHPARIARATQAAIYYGHGLRQDPKDPRYYNPVRLDDLNNDASLTPLFGQPGPGVGRTGPNQYASDWTLLRQVVLLANPDLITRDPLSTGGQDEPTTPLEEPDNRIQISLEPAMSAIFRNLQQSEPGVVPPDNQLVRDGPPVRPRRACGVIDIATQDLSIIRAIVNDAQLVSYNTTFNLAADNPADGLAPNLPGTSAFQIDLPFPAAMGPSTTRMHNYMRQVFPADSGPGADSVPSLGGRRMRYEPSPPDLLGVLGSGGTLYPKEYQRTDQNMLSSFNFVPHCTEFIVEFSFGKVYPPQAGNALAGQMIWYGMNSLSTPDIYPYGDPRLPGGAGYGVYAMPYRKLDGTLVKRNVDVNVVHGPIVPGSPPHEYYYFGYIDPTYAPPAPPLPPDPAAPATVPWPWPRLVRITMSLVDPSDPLKEQTFQFVFEVSENRDDKQF